MSESFIPPESATVAPRPGSLQATWDLCWDIVTNHYADFSGTVDRRTFWTFWLAQLIAGYGSLIVFAPASVVIILGVFIPKLALGARRLHETGRSGWWQLLSFIPFIGTIIVLIMQAQPAKAAS